MWRACLMLLAALIVSACDTRVQRLQAIAEVEQTCGLAPNSFSRRAADAKAMTSKSEPEAPGRPRPAAAHKLIYLGTVSYVQQDVVSKRECVRSYSSKRGYTFTFQVLGPYSLGGNTSPRPAKCESSRPGWRTPIDGSEDMLTAHLIDIRKDGRIAWDGNASDRKALADQLSRNSLKSDKRPILLNFERGADCALLDSIRAEVEGRVGCAQGRCFEESYK